MKSPAQTWSCLQKLHPSLTNSLGYWLVCCASIARSNATGIHHVPTASRPMSPALLVRQHQLVNAAARTKISRNALHDVRNCSSSMPMGLCRYQVLLCLLLLLPLSARCHHFRQPPPTPSRHPPRHLSLHRPASTQLCRGNQVLSLSEKMAMSDLWIVTFGLVYMRSYKKCEKS